VVYLHPANGGARSAVEGAILKGMGVMPGAPDLLLWKGGRSFAIELKSETGRTSESQLEMLDRLSQAGVYTAVARTGSCNRDSRRLRVVERTDAVGRRLHPC